ncbi:MAG: hypothetical protein M5U18_07925 [Dehalococcoidia bacterium]|nr:hypothetical protein [Dehalococcoidia bacterium]
MSNLWFEITAQVPPSLVEEVSDLVRVVAPGGITVEEPVDILGPEEGFRVRGDEPVLIRAYLPSSELGAVLTEDLRRSMEPFPPSNSLPAPSSNRTGPSPGVSSSASSIPGAARSSSLPGSSTRLVRAR